ncbi:MAG TPA: xanthine dehydrogenase family protein molybdopterin-binding subunit [Candidatus Dormibacteraeota bacterium]|nr:xanthine dehydrogenase family protein molybdopterin-binding subunit [Candidatus Dormibacteraeota bacterium]
MSAPPHATGAPMGRMDGPEKVTGRAPYAFEHPVERPGYVHLVQATVARGRVRAMHTARAESTEGVLAVLTPTSAPRLASTADAELAVLQSDRIAFRGQIVGAVVAETLEIARHAADLIRVEYDREPHEVELRADRPDLYAPDHVNPDFPTDTEAGNVSAGLASAAVTLDATYTTPIYHNNPMEPHATTVVWDGDRSPRLTLYDSTQSVHRDRETVARVFGLGLGEVRVIAPYVGGAFGCKVPHAPLILAVLAARALPGRPIKLALTRPQMFSLVGYRTPTVQRLRLGADREGRLTAIDHEVVEQTARIAEFAEQTAVATRIMYAAPNRRTAHRLAELDVPVPAWMRAPGECPGMFALESAIDELAVACGLDPIELRIRNEPRVDPESGRPFSSRHLVACLREGARRFGWADRDPTPRARRSDGWLVGWGVAASTYPVYARTGSTATVRFGPDERYQVLIGATDIGTGTRTALTQIAADALDVPAEVVDLRIGDTELPATNVAGGSMGITAWGSALVDAARAFRDRFGDDPLPGAEATGELPENPARRRFAMHAFGAQFAEVRVREDTGEVRVTRLLGVFDVGRIVNPRTARSQLVGGMTMGLSMALHEQSLVDPRFGHVVNHDLAGYHIAVSADVPRIEAHWLDVADPHANPMGTKGIGEIGIVGTAAAIANAAHHATGIRVRDLPITLDKLMGRS